MKTRIHKLLGILLTLALLGSLTLGLSVPVAASDGSWSQLATPVAGALGSYVLTPAGVTPVGPGPFEKAIDDTLYAAWNVGEGLQGSNLYKSTDGGRTWTRCSTATDDLGAVNITAISLSPQDAARVYVTNGTSVYRSSDAGATFVKLVDPPGAVSAMEVVYSTDHFIYVAVGNDIWLLRDSFGFTWATTNFAAATGLGRTIIDITASPKFSTESLPMVVAINTDGANTRATFSYGGAAWAAPTPGGDDMIIAGIVATAADVAFPADFNSTRTTRDFFVGLSNGAGGGDVYRIIAITIIDLNVNTDITSVAVAGNAGVGKLLVAGLVRNTFHSEDNGLTWTQSDPAGVYPFLSKDTVQATGTTPKYIIMAKDYNTSGKAWIAVSAAGALDEASVAQTADFGASWNDLSMINTDITQIRNMDVSPKYATDSTVFMITTGGSTVGSIWKWDGTYWTRVSVLPAANAATAMIKASPDFNIDKAIFVVDTAANLIYRSTDFGMWFKAQISSPGVINGGVLIVSGSTQFVGSNLNVMITRNNGTSWDPAAITGATGTLFSFAKSPAYSTDKTLLVGDTGGRVFISKNDGVTWTQVPVGGQVAATAGALNVAFDSGYATNNFIMAAGAGSDRVYRINAATGTTWSTIDGGSGAQAGSINGNVLVPGIQMAADGTLYVSTPRGVGTTTGTAAAADAFRIFDAVGGDFGTIVVTSGAVTVTAGGTGVIERDAFTITAAAADAFTMTATGAGTVTVAATTGSVTMAVTTEAGGTATTIAAGVITFGDVGDVVTVTATAAGTAGTITPGTGTSTDAVSVDVDADATVTSGASFTLPDIGQDSGTITVTTGAVSVATTGGATYTTTTGAWAFTGPGQTIVVTADAVNTTGSWTRALAATGSGATAAITTDFDADPATVAATGGAFSLPDGALATGVVAAPAFIEWSTPASGDSILVTTSTAPAAGTWTANGMGLQAVASMVSDVDVDASVTNPSLFLGPGVFSLPDVASTATTGTGATQLVIRSLTGTRTFHEALTSGFSPTGNAGNVMGVWYNDGTPAGSPQIWILESSTTATGNRIWMYTDRLTKAGTLASPADKSSTGRVTTATLVWNALSTATVYEVQVSLNNTFTAQVGTPVYTSATSYAATGLADGTTYYWRVRSAPNTNAAPNAGRASSPFSATWSFTTGISAAEWTPFENADNVAPAPGAQGVNLRPTFQWNPADWATGYEFALDDNADFSSTIKSFAGASALVTTTYALDQDLSYNTAYYWRVRAISATSSSLYAYGVFTTMTQPTTPPPPVTITTQPPATITIPPVQEITPAWIWAIVIIGGVLVIAVIVLIVTTRRVP